MGFADWVQNNEVSLNSVWLADAARLKLGDVVNKQNV
jgi:hypothetical protein